jgi:peptidoglycan/xylan/chitin deacetylase (PgdA/CDA1 family)
MYHSVSAVADGPLRDLAVPPDALREQLTSLADAGYALTGLTEAIRRKQESPAARVVGLTFDDGYLDFLDAGLEVLQATGAGATLYISVGHMGPGAPELMTSPVLGPLLSWDQTREVAKAGVEIGNHSLIHQPMDVLPHKVVDSEVRISKDRLEQELGSPVVSFAYPHGYNSRRVRNAVAAAGHHNACEVGRRLYDDVTADSYAIPRLQITPDHSGEDVLRIVRTGEPGLAPTIKRLAQPAWRVARWTALNVAGKRLT